jgi:hypothetical protein
MQPPAYNRTKDFTENFGSETDHSALNAELDAVSNSTNTIRVNLALMQADDGKIKASAITIDSLSQSVIDDIIDDVSEGITTYRDQAAISASASSTFASQANQEKLDAQAARAAAEAAAATVAAQASHLTDSANPHNVTKTQVGLGNVDNTSDLNKPVSTAQQAALDLKANDSAVVHKTGDETIAGVKTFSDHIVIATSKELQFAGATANIQVNGVDRITVNADGAVNLYNPAFSAYSNTTVSLPTGTFVKILYQVEEYDKGSGYDHTASRFVAPVAGVYRFTAAATMATAAAQVLLRLYKNGTAVKQGAYGPSVIGATVDADIELAAGDTVEVYCSQSAATQSTGSGGAQLNSYFQGHLVRAA